ncbi:hypothetical protein V6N13_040627 [Hibiscus sabdariffa]|uniref:RDR1/2-like PH-like domain-containing protein n=1 Tax=Hibiscus sabdariffa TaxID=183260 RepID=A0ABR2R9C4_9ROSI
MLTPPHAGNVDDKANTGELGMNRQSKHGPPLEHGQQPNASQPCHPPTKAKAYALVQVTKTADAERITSLASQGLWCPTSQLEVQEMETELVSNPKVYLHTTEAGTMHFGCKVSEEKTIVLWTANNVTVKFVLAMKKLLFLLSYGGLEHKLELFYENIRWIGMHPALDQTTKHMLI